MSLIEKLKAQVKGNVMRVAFDEPALKDWKEGEPVYVKYWNGRERIVYDKWISKNRPDLTERKDFDLIAVATLTLCDQDGKRIYETVEEGYNDVGELPLDVIGCIALTALRVLDKAQNPTTEN